MTAVKPMTDAELKKHDCLEAVDRVSGDPDTTAFKRRARLHQAMWRKGKGLKVGSQPMRPSPDAPGRDLGSRIDLSDARECGTNFLNNNIRRAVGDRLSKPQPHQMLNEDRLYCDLLSSMPMCFNLFGDLWADVELADRAVHTWWPNVPGRVTQVRFEWSPGRCLPDEYLENRSAFDVAFELELQGGGYGILGVETKYHEDCKAERKPSDDRCKRYAAVASESGILSLETVEERILGTQLQQIWLDHLLALSMLQHPSGKWKWAGFVLVHPAMNPSYARATERYRALLTDASSIRVTTLESLLAADVLPESTASAFRQRYLW